MVPPPRMAESAQRQASIGPSLPTQPLSMKRAVMMPQAMKAAMFGMIMPDRNVPNLCTRTRAPPCVVAGDVVVMMSSLSCFGWVVEGSVLGCRLRGRTGASGVVRLQRGSGDASGIVEAVLRDGAAHVGEGGRSHRQARRAEADEHHRQQRVGCGFAADADGLAGAGAGVADLAHEAQHGR